MMVPDMQIIILNPGDVESDVTGRWTEDATTWISRCGELQGSHTIGWVVHLFGVIPSNYKQHMLTFMFTNTA